MKDKHCVKNYGVAIALCLVAGTPIAQTTTIDDDARRDPKVRVIRGQTQAERQAERDAQNPQRGNNRSANDHDHHRSRPDRPPQQQYNGWYDNPPRRRP